MEQTVKRLDLHGFSVSLFWRLKNTECRRRTDSLLVRRSTLYPEVRGRIMQSLKIGIKVC
jgi:hypothetical protein